MHKTINLNYNVPIAEAGILDNDFVIEGVAINATTTGNNHKFLAEELRASAGTLNGVPLLVDHRNEVSAIKGRVSIGEYDEVNSRINFKAKVIDNEIKQMIKNKLINSVSVGASVKEIEEQNDVLIPRGIEFKELSLVAVPADAGATFATALQEAYSTIREADMVKCKECGKMIDKDKLKAHMSKHEEEVEDKQNNRVSSLSQSLPKQEGSQSMKGGIKMSEEITQKAEQKVEAKIEAKEDNSAKLFAETLSKLTEEMREMRAAIAESKKVKTDEVKAKAVVEVEESTDGVKGGKYNFMFEQQGGKGSYTLVR